MRFTRWNQEATTRVSNEQLAKLALWHCAHAETCEARYLVESALKAGDVRFLSVYELRYDGITPHTAYHLRQALAFFSKRQDTDLGVEREAVAHRKFIESEDLCWETNTLFREHASGKLALPPDVEAVLYRAQRIIARILGNVPKLVDLAPVFGPGATTQVKKQDASPRSKLGQAFACSEDLLPIVKYCLTEMQAWIPFPEGSESAEVIVEIHPGKLAFVPKNAKTDRAIVVEPMLNSMYQLAVGSFMARRLERFGVDIRDQSLNQRLAREGSLTGALATLDLSSASDTVASELVFNLLPVDWAHFLSYFRTSEVTYRGESIKLQKFSSMGNGFTFPLETLIFYALARASTEQMGASGPVNAYGDDIICPTAAYPLLVRVLTTAGFIPNESKSFASGPFRESCGADYLSGTDIRPFYQKGPLSGETAFLLHNFYVRHGLPEAALLVLEWIDESLRLFGPDGYGDGHLVGDHPRRAHKREDGWSGYIFDTFTWKSRRSFRIYQGDRVLPSYTVYASPSQDDATRSYVPFTYYLGRGKTGRWSPSQEPSNVHEQGRLGVVTPGKDGYKRISVYTLI